MIKTKKVSEGIYEVSCKGEHLGKLVNYSSGYEIKLPNGKLVKAANLTSAKKLIELAIK